MDRSGTTCWPRSALRFALVAGSAALALCGCQGVEGLGLASVTGTSSVSVDYYSIAGNSIQALDTQIKRKGPKIGRNRHAVAVARIAMQPKMTYARERAGCSVASANVAVNARVTLPAWTGRAGAAPALGAKWDNIDRYTRLHEAVHVAIAFRHARALEAALLALPPQRDCAKARLVALAKSRKALKRHDRAQQRFDRNEQRRIAAMRRRAPGAADSFGQPDIPKGLGLSRAAAPAAASHGGEALTTTAAAEAGLRGS